MNSQSYLLKLGSFFLLICFNTHFLIAQNDKWKEGIILTKSKEQFIGCIKKSKLYSREQVEIKLACQKKKKLFFSKDVERYTWDDETYRSVFVPARITPYEPVLIIKDKGFHYFLRVVTEGKFNLYVFEYEFGSGEKYPKSLILENFEAGSMWISPGKINMGSRRELKKLKSFFQADAEVSQYLNGEDIDYYGFVEVLDKVNKR